MKNNNSSFLEQKTMYQKFISRFNIGLLRHEDNITAIWHKYDNSDIGRTQRQQFISFQIWMNKIDKEKCYNPQILIKIKF